MLRIENIKRVGLGIVGRYYSKGVGPGMLRIEKIERVGLGIEGRDYN